MQDNYICKICAEEDQVCKCFTFSSILFGLATKTLATCEKSKLNPVFDGVINPIAYHNWQIKPKVRENHYHSNKQKNTIVSNHEVDLNATLASH